MKKFKSIIVINRVNKIDEDISFINNNLDNYGNVFYIFKNIYTNEENLDCDIFDILNKFLHEGYFYKNIIVFPLENPINLNSYIDNTGYILWITKSNKNKYFNKDPIREKHIWKDIEWGKREKNYSSKGKDPSNVWIPTEDDSKGNITFHYILTFEQILKRIKNMIVCDSEHDLKIIGSKKDLYDEQNDKIESLHINNNVAEFNEKQTHKVYFLSSENMDMIDNKTVDFAITSPPYWDLKDYYKQGQIGQESYDIYIERLESVFSEIYLKLKDDGAFWLNINIRRSLGNVTLNPKDIINLFIKIGYYYKGIIIWHKSSGIPVNKDNLSDKYEFIFLFSKKKDYVINQHYFHCLSDYKNDILNGKSFWNINRKAGSIGTKFIHPAIYPVDLVTRSIKLNSNPGDTILDPFLGSGTSLISAINIHRNFIGFEYNEGFKDLIIYRVSKETKNSNNIEYITEV